MRVTLLHRMNDHLCLLLVLAIATAAVRVVCMDGWMEACMDACRTEFIILTNERMNELLRGWSQCRRVAGGN